MLEIPSYIAAAAIAGAPLDYQWKPDQDIEIVSSYSQNIEKLVSALALRATLSLALGIGEWMTWRLDGLSTYRQCGLYLEAIWARTVDKAYLKNSKGAIPKDTGDPTVGPLLALELAIQGVFVRTTRDGPERGKGVAELVSLVRYTLPGKSEFDNWLRDIIKKLEDSYQISSNGRAGPIVPRAFLDPAKPVDPAAIPTLLDEQLKQIEWQGNPFLASPDEMRSAGFAGTPYRYLP